MLSPKGLQQRSQLLQAVRSFFFSREYIEVDTPHRLPLVLPESNILPFSTEKWVLQTSPELCMKRLLARGCKRLFQICHCFRKEEEGRLHQSEFSMLEWYHVGWDYLDLMDECESLLHSLCKAVPDLLGIDEKGQLTRQQRTVDIRRPWRRLTVADAFCRYGSLSVEEALQQDSFDEILVSEIEPWLGWGQPVFLYDYPVELASLAKKKQGNPTVAERFELYICGVEIANGFSELVDSQEQRDRFCKEILTIEQQGQQAAMPEKFLDDLGELGETAGIALGLDRLFMLLMNKASVAEAMSFAMEEL